MEVMMSLLGKGVYLMIEGISILAIQEWLPNLAATSSGIFSSNTRI